MTPPVHFGELGIFFHFLMQSLMGETTAVAHGGNPQDRAASPRPRCIAGW
ncbi:hypothetical protein [Moorena sp. SIOASIH]|nr:hypothetical protein [Moorena sp. SIOASIH]